VSTLGAATFEGITTDGYGIRSSLVDAGAFINKLTARGNGHQLDSRNFDSGVRQSESFSLDKYFGTVPNVLTDLHAYLGTNKKVGTIKGVTTSGQIRDDIIRAQRDLNSVDAFQILADNPGNVPVESDDLYPMRINMGGAIGTVTVRDKVNGLRMTSSSLKTFNPFNDARNVSISVSGKIDKVRAEKSLLSSVEITAKGPNGEIGSVFAGRELNAAVWSQTNINEIFVGTDLETSQARGGIQAKGNVGKITVKDNVNPFAFVQIKGRIGTLAIAGDIKKHATVRAGAIDKQIIGGDIIGDLEITG
jgi:hypothetical protein